MGGTDLALVGNDILQGRNDCKAHPSSRRQVKRFGLVVRGHFIDGLGQIYSPRPGAGACAAKYSLQSARKSGGLLTCSGRSSRTLFRKAWIESGRRYRCVWREDEVTQQLGKSDVLCSSWLTMR